MDDKLKLWKSVEKTDPKYTKPFTKGGGFSGTAINATYLIRKATELWGPMGNGWGPIVVDEKYVNGADGTIIHVLRIDLLHPHGKVPSFGQTTFVGKNKHGLFTDEEAPKKSLTDAITKGLSMLGFSADVFLGLYDDNKYVNDRKQEFSVAGVSPFKGPILPNSGAGDDLDAETKKMVELTAEKIKEALAAGKDWDAYALCESFTDDMLGEKLYCWKFLDSTERRRIKTQAEAAKQKSKAA
jgi:hypothetical protein